MSSAQSGLNIAQVVELLVASGLLTGITELARWFISGRKRERVDTAKVVQGMALDLLTPLHAELASAYASANSLRDSMRSLEAEMESVLGWAIIARHLLDANHVTYPPAPEPILKRVV